MKILFIILILYCILFLQLKVTITNHNTIHKIEYQGLFWVFLYQHSNIQYKELINLGIIKPYNTNWITYTKIK